MRRVYLMLCCLLPAGFCMAQNVPPPAYIPPRLAGSASPKETATRMIFSITYAMKEICYSTGYPDLEKLQIAIDRFRKAYPNIMRLEDQSPFLGMSRAEPISGKEFEDFLNKVLTSRIDEKSDAIDEDEWQSCDADVESLNAYADEKLSPRDSFSAVFIPMLNQN